MKIGLVGEAPTDTTAIENLLSKKYKNCEFIPLLNRINGSQLESQKTKRNLRREFEFKKPDLVIFIRDLDSLKSDTIQLAKRKEYFSNFNTVVDKKGILLLHIYEIEAMLLSDIDSFNKYFSTEIIFNEDPSHIREPKEFLIENCKDYSISINDKIFEYLNFDTLLKKCSYFNEFIEKFEKRIGVN